MENEEKQLITQEPLDGTPFVITGNQEKGYFLRMGAYRLTDYLATPEDVITTLDTEHWQITLTMIAAVLHSHGHNEIAMEKEKLTEIIPTN